MARCATQKLKIMLLMIDLLVIPLYILVRLFFYLANTLSWMLDWGYEMWVEDIDEFFNDYKIRLAIVCSIVYSFIYCYTK